MFRAIGEGHAALALRETKPGLQPHEETRGQSVVMLGAGDRGVLRDRLPERVAREFATQLLASTPNAGLAAYAESTETARQETASHQLG